VQHQTMVMPNGDSLLLIHFIYRAPGGSVDENGESSGGDVWRVACAPGMEDFAAHAVGQPFPWQRTEEPLGVTCPLCKETEKYRRAVEDRGGVLGRRKR